MTDHDTPPPVPALTFEPDPELTTLLPSTLAERSTPPPLVLPAPAPAPSAAAVLVAAQQTAPPVAPAYRFVVADDPTPWSTAEHAGPLTSLPLEARLAAWERLTAGGTAAVVICSPQQAPQLRRDSALARTADDVRIVVLPLPVGPLAQLVASRMAQSMLGSGLDRPVSELVVALPELSTALVDLALVRSVTRLDLPGIRLGHHLASYLPGRTQFAVQVAPAARVSRLDRTGDLRAEPAAPDVDPAFGAVITALGPAPVPPAVVARCGGGTPVPEQAEVDLAGYWHDTEATEIVVSPADVSGWVLSRLPGLERWPCSWCAEPMAAPMQQCPFCGHTRR